MHTYLYIYICVYIRIDIHVLCVSFILWSLQVVSLCHVRSLVCCVVLSLCYVQSLVCVMCRLQFVYACDIHIYICRFVIRCSWWWNQTCSRNHVNLVWSSITEFQEHSDMYAAAIHRFSFLLGPHRTASGMCISICVHIYIYIYVYTQIP